MKIFFIMISLSLIVSAMLIFISHPKYDYEITCDESAEIDGTIKDCSKIIINNR